MIWINCLRLTLTQPRVAQPHRKTAGSGCAGFEKPDVVTPSQKI